MRIPFAGLCLVSTLATGVAFAQPLPFNEAGVTSFSYSDIVNEITYTEAYRRLSLVGAERTVGKLPTLRSAQPEDGLSRDLSMQYT